MAVDNDDVKAVEYLIEYGVNLHIADMRGITPLHLSVARKQVRITELLLEAGADPNVEVPSSLLRFLPQYGVSLDSATKEQDTQPHQPKKRNGKGGKSEPKKERSSKREREKETEKGRTKKKTKNSRCNKHEEKNTETEGTRRSSRAVAKKSIQNIHRIFDEEKEVARRTEVRGHNDKDAFEDIAFTRFTDTVCFVDDLHEKNQRLTRTAKRKRDERLKEEEEGPHKKKKKKNAGRKRRKGEPSNEDDEGRKGMTLLHFLAELYLPSEVTECLQMLDVLLGTTSPLKVRAKLSFHAIKFLHRTSTRIRRRRVLRRRRRREDPKRHRKGKKRTANRRR